MKQKFKIGDLVTYKDEDGEETVGYVAGVCVGDEKIAVFPFKKIVCIDRKSLTNKTIK